MLVNAQLKDEGQLWISPECFMLKERSEDGLEFFAGAKQNTVLPSKEPSHSKV